MNQSHHEENFEPKKEQISQETIDVILAEEVIPGTDEKIGPKKPELPTPKKILTDEELEQIQLMKKLFPQANSIIMYEQQSAIQVDFPFTPIILSEVIRNLEDRGYSKIAEFPCKCNCGGYSLILAKDF